MADYWKSQPKKFCQYCKCWIADNKPCIEFHERGKNHKENVAAKIEEIKKKSLAKAKQEKKMSKEFAAMEEAAQKAYEEDLKRLTGAGESLSASPAPAPAPKPQTKSKKRQVKGKVKESSKIQTGSTWVEGRTDDGQIYYYNVITGESQWENPDVFQGGSTSSSSSSPSSLLLPPGTGPMQVSSGSGWIEAVSPDGYTYYYNTETGESSWEKPHDLNTPDGSSHEETQEEATAPPPQSESPSDGDAAPPPQPESLSGGEETSESPKETKEEPADVKQTKVAKISFRKRKEEPDQTSGDDGGQKASDGEKHQEKEAVTSAPTTVEVKVTPAKKPRKINPYGAWEQIQPEDDPYEKVDLQLPHVETAVPAPDLTPEPRPKFKERTITSLGQGEEGNAGATFKRRKTENGKSRSLRQREDDD